MNIAKKMGGRPAGVPVFGTLAWWAVALLSALLLSACAQERVAGGDDFPNSVETLGKNSAAERDDSTEWNGYKSAPDTAPGLYDSTYVPDSIPRDDGGLLKSGIIPVGLTVIGVVPGQDIPGTFRALDTLPGQIAGVTCVVRTQTFTGLQVRDTTWYRRDSLGAILLLRAAGRAEGTGGVKVFAFEDGDGDGFLSPRAGSANIAVIRISTTAADGSAGEKSSRVAAGPDRSFNRRADNTLLAYAEVLRKSLLADADTLLSIMLRDADGDGFLLSPLRDTNLVDVDWVNGAPGARLSLYYRLAAFADRGRNYPVRFRSEFENGARVTETVALGRDSLPDFAPGDTGRVLVTFASSAAADTLERSESLYRVILSDTAGRFTGNRLVRVDRTRSFRFGAATGARYTLWPAAPVPDGSLGRDGSVALRVDLRAGGWIAFTGTATAAGWVGTWLDSEAGGGTVHFDASGNVTSASTAP